MFKHSQDAHKRYGDHNKYHCFLLVVIMGSVFLIVGGISYAAYLFIDATRVSDASGIHITKNILLAVSDLEGKLYSDPSRGIKNWMIHTDSAHGYEIRHPNDWQMQEGPGIFIHLKKYASSSSRNNSLISDVEVGNISLTEGDNLENVALKRGIVWNPSWKEELFAGRMGVRTGKIKTTMGFFRDAIFWKNEETGKVFYLEATYYTDKSLEFENIFNNMVSEFKFI